MAHAEVAHSIAHERDDKRMESRALYVRGSCLRMMGRPAEAIEPGLEAITLGREAGDAKVRSQALYLVSLAYAYLGKHELAIKYARELAQLAEQSHDVMTEGGAYDTISASLAAQHKYEEAKVNAERSMELLRKAAYRDWITYVANTQGLIELGMGQGTAARRYFQEALDIAHDDGYTRPEALVRFNIAHSHRLEGDYAAALRYANESLELFRKIQSLDTPAAEALIQVINDAQRGDRAAEAAHLLDLARASATNVDLYSALSLAEESRDLAQSLGDVAVVEAATALIEEFHARAVAE
jgi:tetratricopeptide (TPR) repeat protein